MMAASSKVASVVKRLRSLLGATGGTGTFARSVAVLAGGTALGQVLALAASPLLTRLYTPADFGVLAAYTSILSIPVVVASMCYEIAIPLPEDDGVAVYLLVLSLAIAVGTTVLVGIAVWLLGDLISVWTQTPVLRPYLWLLPLGFLGMGVYRAFAMWAVRKNAFGQLARTKLNQALGAVVTQVGLGLLRLGPVGLLVGDVVGRVSGSGTLAYLAWKQAGSLLKRDRAGPAYPVQNRNVDGGPQAREPHPYRQVAHRYRNFPLVSSGSVLLNSAGLQLPTLLLTAFYGTQVSGWFSLGQRVIGVPMLLVGQAVAQVYLGEAARLAQGNPAALSTLYHKTARRLLLVGAIPILILAAGGPWLFGLVFGAPWREAGVYVQLLALMFVAQFIVVPLSQTLNVLERQDWQLLWDAARLVLVVGGLLLANSLSWSAQTAVTVYGVNMLLTYGVLFVMSGAVIRQRLRSSG